MAAPSDSDFDTALDSIVEGTAQAYTIGNRSVTKLDPEMLLRVKKMMQKEAAGGSRITVAKMRKASQ